MGRFPCGPKVLSSAVTDLEAPGLGSDGAPEWGAIYRARGEEVVAYRPVVTGDVFEKVEVAGGEVPKHKTVIVLQHPCALRTNGVDLVERVLVAEVRPHKLIDRDRWLGYTKLMPLPELRPELHSQKRDQAALFEELFLVAPELLEIRIASLSQIGVNLLMQRWVHHNSRAVVPTMTYQRVTSAAFEETDLIEEWCEQRVDAGIALRDAARECVNLLREDVGGGNTRQHMLEDEQNRSTVRRQIRSALRALR